MKLYCNKYIDKIFWISIVSVFISINVSVLIILPLGLFQAILTIIVTLKGKTNLEEHYLKNKIFGASDSFFAKYEKVTAILLFISWICSLYVFFSVPNNFQRYIWGIILICFAAKFILTVIYYTTAAKNAKDS